MLRPPILILDDDPSFLNSLKMALEPDYRVVSSSRWSDAIDVIASTPFRAVLCDYFLDMNNGHLFAEALAKSQPACRFILMSALFDKDILLTSFRYPIFDVLEKPLDLARCKESLERALGPDETGLLNIHLDVDRRVVITKQSKIALTEVEFKIIQCLKERENKLVQRQELVRFVWGEVSVADSNLDTHLSNLKRKFPLLKKHLEVVRGAGYVLNGKV